MINLRRGEEIDKIRRAGKIVARVLDKIKGELAAGVTTAKLDSWIKDFVLQSGGVCAFLGYRGFPASSCISVNEEVVHGIPSEARVLKNGDIVGIDVGVGYEGYFADAAVTYPVGSIEPKYKKLLEATKKALDLGIKEARADNYLSNVSCIIQRHAEAMGFSVVRDFAGHGIGREIHEEPEIPNFGRPDCGVKLKQGMVLAIEPMVNFGSWQIEVAPDGWTARTRDRSYSAHFEHTVAIFDSGPEVLTRI